MDKDTAVINGENIQQPVDTKNILEGVIAYVDVRSGEDNRTQTFRKLLQSLGAKVTPGLNKTVTHVIFRDGPKKTYEKAKRRGLFILSAAWVSSCLKNGYRVPEEQFKAILSSDYDSPFAKIRMVKSLRPLSFEEYQKRDNANRKRLKTRRERQEIRQKYLKTPPALHIPKDYSKYGQITFPSPLKLPDLPEEDYDIEDPYTLPLSLRILKQNPVANSPVLDFLTSEKQRQVANKIIETYGGSSSHKSTKEITPNRKEDLFDISHDLLKDTTPPALLEIQSTDSNIQRLSNCVNESTPTAVRKRKRSKTPPEKQSVSQVGIGLGLNNSLEDFKLTKRPGKRLKIANLNDVFNESILDMCSTKSTKIKHIVLTSFNLCQKETIIPIIKHLGTYRLETVVGKKTTHVICKPNVRTFNVLMGIVSGCWILQGDWIMDSLEAGTWVNEQNYELTGFPAARICRQKRDEMGLDYYCDLFKETDTIYVDGNTTLPRTNLTMLLSKAGAKVVKKNKADIIIGIHVNGRKCVSEQWALDSITNYKVLPLEDYKLHKS